MKLSEELQRLDELRQSGVLSSEEFSRAKAQLLGNCATVTPLAALDRLRRSTSERWIAGVCGGIAYATGTGAWIWRLLFALLFFFGGTGLVLYLLMWLFVPADSLTER
jgi:phage shock protein PspC (stress-responsive transcriptional regulator)